MEVLAAIAVVCVLVWTGAILLRGGPLAGCLLFLAAATCLSVDFFGFNAGTVRLTIDRVFWGVVMAFFCLLPFGAWVIWLPAALGLLAGDQIARGIILLALGVGIVSMADNVLRLDRPLFSSGFPAASFGGKSRLLGVGSHLHGRFKGLLSQVRK